MAHTQPLEPTEAFGRIGHIKLADTSIDDVLHQLADLAVRTVPGAEQASVTLVRGRAAHTAASTGDLALALDEWQYEQGHGPCLDAAANGGTVTVRDTATEPRWPRWAADARSLGVRGSLCIGLPVQESVSGALNIYATAPDAFDAEAVLLAETFAGYATVALSNAHLYDLTATLARHLHAAMESRAVIEQAKGIIIGQRRCSADDAFAVLSRLSQDTNRKIRDVATALVTDTAGH